MNRAETELSIFSLITILTRLYRARSPIRHSYEKYL